MPRVTWASTFPAQRRLSEILEKKPSDRVWNEFGSCLAPSNVVLTTIPMPIWLHLCGTTIVAAHESKSSAIVNCGVCHSWHKLQCQISINTRRPPPTSRALFADLIVPRNHFLTALHQEISPSMSWVRTNDEDHIILKWKFLLCTLSK